MKLETLNSCERGLSLIEIMVTVTLLVVIILGLTAMFNQTRKAFTVGLGNVDYQDAGRTTMDLISRELEQMTPTDFGLFPNGAANGLNFYTDVSPDFITSPANAAWPMTAGDTTNFSLERLYFVTRYGQQWNAIGYRLLPSDAALGVGTLYRYGYDNVAPGRLTGYYNSDPINDFLNPASTNGNRVIDGVVDFRVRAYDRNGMLVPTRLTQYKTPVPGGTVTNYTGNADMPPLLFTWPPPLPSPPPYWLDANPASEFLNTNIYFSQASTGDYQYNFYSNAVPAYVEVELGILESPTLAKLQALTNTVGTPNGAYWQFLTNHAGLVHIFRERVNILAADPAAYP